MAIAEGHYCEGSATLAKMFDSGAHSHLVKWRNGERLYF